MTHPRRRYLHVFFKARHALNLILTAAGLSLTIDERAALEATDNIIKRLREQEEKRS